MSKDKVSEVTKARKAQVYQNEALAGLKALRKKGILTREQFRRLSYQAGLPNGLKGSPMVTNYVPDPKFKGKKGTAPLVAVRQQLVRV